MEEDFSNVRSAGITTPALISFVLFIVLDFPIIYFVPAWKVQKLLEVQVFVSAATLLGIMAYAVHVSRVTLPTPIAYLLPI